MATLLSQLLPARFSQQRRLDALHLPAHGRGSALPGDLRRLLGGRPGSWDLPELPLIGGPLEAEGAVADSQREAAAAVGADQCWYGVNGATGLLQAALLAIATPGSSVLMPRNVHRSLIQACALGGITPLLFDLPFLPDRGHVAALEGPWLARVLQELDRQKQRPVAAVLVQPTYHGYASDPLALVAPLQARGLPVLVDEAHGAHLLPGVDPNQPRSALAAGADLVVHSLHKSAAGLGQTAVLWAQGTAVDSDAIARSLGWLQTTSPSALLLVSCEAALGEWRSVRGRRRLNRRFDQARALAVQLRDSGLPLLETQDPLRLIWHTAAAGINGLDADPWLMERGLIAELPEPGCLTFCLGLARHPGLARRMKRLWRDLCRLQAGTSPAEVFSAPPLPLLGAPELDVRAAWCGPKRSVPLAQAAGAIAAQLICPYPPGIPLVIPGERLDSLRVQWLLEQAALWPDQIDGMVKIVA
jgi:arginine/lysine/ornithine decarboxylase